MLKVNTDETDSTSQPPAPKYIVGANTYRPKPNMYQQYQPLPAQSNNQHAYNYAYGNNTSSIESMHHVDNTVRAEDIRRSEELEEVERLVRRQRNTESAQRYITHIFNA
jgi:hypothetical protein